MQAISAPVVDSKSRFSDLSELVKARLTTLVLLTTVVGFCMGCRGGIDWFLLWKTLLGTALLAGGAAALNQYAERDLDALMERTRDRPLPAGRIRPTSALAGGLLASALGILVLAAWVNRLSALVGAATLLSYLLVYTPLKR
ncbi:MAG: UbiA family prenyltransferase, partial [Verrucomicrobiae bacterium]|nr:UbiA family prenyltransferase [Verrucomicrobiae bacterium]